MLTVEALFILIFNGGFQQIFSAVARLDENTQLRLTFCFQLNCFKTGFIEIVFKKHYALVSCMQIIL